MSLRIIISMMIVSGSVSAGTSIQTDWSGGPGLQGPVIEWGNCFWGAENANWLECPGGLILGNCSEVHLVDSIRSKSAAAADFDCDGDIDVLIQTISNSFILLFNLDYGLEWESDSLSIPLLYNYAVSDFDGDGDPDIAGIRGCTTIMYWNQGNSIWVPDTIQIFSGTGMGFVLGDFNCDFNTDIALSVYQHGIVWLENPGGSGVWTCWEVSPSAAISKIMCSGDIDGDGDTDLISCKNDSILIYVNQDTGLTWERDPLGAANGNIKYIYMSELDGSPPMECLATVYSGLTLFWNSGDMWESQILSTLIKSVNIALPDVDLDGDPDVFSGDQEIGFWLENPGVMGELWPFHDSECVISTYAVNADISDDNKDDVFLGHSYNSSAGSRWIDFYEYLPEGQITSSILDVGYVPQWNWFTWDAALPAGTSLGFMVRASGNPDFLGLWSAIFYAPFNLEDMLPDSANFFQYRLVMETDDSRITPILHQVAAEWTPLGLAEEEPRGFALSSPNPTCCGGKLTFSVPEAASVRIEAFDVSGRLIFILTEEIFQPGQYDVSFPDLPPGIYIIRMISGEFVASEMLTVFR